MVINERDILGT